MSRAELQKNILITVAYYDGMDYPLTAFEIWKYLIKIKNQKSKIKNEEEFFLSDVIKELDEYNLKRFIEEFRGFYFLRGRRELVERRIKRDKISAGKMKRLRKVIWMLRFAPFVRMIAVTGRLAMKNADEKSDWDALIVLKKGRIWTGRTSVTVFLHFIGKRRHGNKIRDRICLNHFITDESLEIRTKEIEGLFPANEFFFILPVFDTGVFAKFQLKNKWIKEFKPNYHISEIDNLKLLGDRREIGIIREIGEKFLNWNFLENWLRSWESQKIMRNPKTKMPGSFVRFSDDYLIFLPEPQGAGLLEQLKMKVDSLGDF